MRASYIGRSLEVQETFSFAAPSEILGAVKLYAADLYGGMLTRLGNSTTAQLTNCWNVTVKDSWGVPRATHLYITRWLGSGHTSLKYDLIARWVKFYKSLLHGPSPEVATVARMAAADVRSTTGENVKYIIDNLGLDPEIASVAQVRNELAAREPTLSEMNVNILRNLGRMIEERSTKMENGEDIVDITMEIDNICTN